VKLSVVIPVYNEAATIEQLIDAVEKAPVPDIEIIEGKEVPFVQ